MGVKILFFLLSQRKDWSVQREIAPNSELKNTDNSFFIKID
jgi:hypothetical protein